MLFVESRGQEANISIMNSLPPPKSGRSTMSWSIFCRKKHSVTKNCSDLSPFEQIVLEISKFLKILGLKPRIWIFFSRSLKQFFLTVGQNNFVNKILLLTVCRLPTSVWAYVPRNHFLNALLKRRLHHADSAHFLATTNNTNWLKEILNSVVVCAFWVHTWCLHDLT